MTLQNSINAPTPFALAKGGTGQSLSAVDNAVMITSSSGAVEFLANGTAGYVLTANSGAPPSWQAGGGGGGGITTITADDATSTTGPSVEISGGDTGLTTTISGAELTFIGTLLPVNGGTGVANYEGSITLTGDPGAGSALISDGVGNATWGTPSFTINGDSGSATGNPITFNASTGTASAGASITFQGAVEGPSFITLSTTDSYGNTFIGQSAGSPGSSMNQYNTSVGNAALSSTGSLGSTAFGYNALTSGTSGNYNSAFGFDAGINYSSDEANNICINSRGVPGESNALHIGAGTGTGTQQLTTAYISGIVSATYTAGSPTPQLVYIDTSTGQLSTSPSGLNPLNTVTSGFGSITVNSAVQNSLGYDVLLSLNVLVTAATSATLTIGVGSTSTPTKVAFTPSFTVATATQYHASVILPNGYYVLVGDTGTITLSSITTIATQL